MYYLNLKDNQELYQKGAEWLRDKYYPSHSVDFIGDTVENCHIRATVNCPVISNFMPELLYGEDVTQEFLDSLQEGLNEPSQSSSGVDLRELEVGDTIVLRNGDRHVVADVYIHQSNKTASIATEDHRVGHNEDNIDSRWNHYNNGKWFGKEESVGDIVAIHKHNKKDSTVTFEDTRLTKYDTATISPKPEAGEAVAVSLDAMLQDSKHYVFNTNSGIKKRDEVDYTQLEDPVKVERKSTYNSILS